MDNIFDIHNEIISAYKNYIDSFINIADKDIRDKVSESFDSDNLYPDPLLQFNPLIFQRYLITFLQILKLKV